MRKPRITLIQPQNQHRRHVYLPNGPLHVGARLMEAGAEVELIDFNLDRFGDSLVSRALLIADVIGISVIGAPLIPSVLALVNELRLRGYRQPIVIGGEGVTRLTGEQFARIFSDQRYGQIRQAASGAPLAPLFGLEREPTDMFGPVSMVPMLDQLPPARLRAYLTREFCLFTANGCIYRCRFCAANKNTREQYRSLDALAAEVEFICNYLARIDHGRFECYLSSLDVLQSPDLALQSLKMVDTIALRHGLTVTARGLATSKCTVKAVERDPDILHWLCTHGLRILGFGADGADSESWRRQGKAHNRLDEIERVFALCREAGIQPEMLMVMGFPGDNATTMLNSISYSLRHARQKVVIRPFLAKAMVPGSDEWNDPQVVGRFLDQPLALERLDYTMLGSQTTHDDPYQRVFANGSYLALLGLLALIGRPSTTHPLVPPPASGPWRSLALAFNRLMPADR